MKRKNVAIELCRHKHSPPRIEYSSLFWNQTKAAFFVLNLKISGWNSLVERNKASNDCSRQGHQSFWWYFAVAIQRGVSCLKKLRNSFIRFTQKILERIALLCFYTNWVCVVWGFCVERWLIMFVQEHR